MDTVDQLLEKYRVSKEYGFLVDCQDVKLPDSFQEWIQISDSLSTLIETREIRKRIENMEIVDTTTLKYYNEKRLAHAYLITLVSGYLWCEGIENVVTSLPKTLTIPLVELSEEVGLSPVVSHSDTCLPNWKLIDRSKPFHPDNLDVITFNPLGTRGCAWFFVVTAQIEKDFGPALWNILNLINSSKNNNNVDKQLLSQTFEEISNFLTKSLDSFKMMKDHLTPKEFYHGVRPYLWGYNVGKLEKDGIIFQGFEDKGPFKLAGATAAQSCTIPVLDAFLKINHTGSDKEFLVEQLDYMPREHRELIQFIRKNSPISMDDGGRNDVVQQLVAFRSKHLQIVAQYILTQTSAATGTGGSPFMVFLKNLRKDTV